MGSILRRRTGAGRVREVVGYPSATRGFLQGAAQDGSPPRASLRAIMLLIWAPQGGPGASALLGNFYELGPYLLTEDLELWENPGRYARCEIKDATTSCATCSQSKLPRVLLLI